MRAFTQRRQQFEQFAGMHAVGLVNLGVLVGGERSRAEDAAQEALIRVYQRWVLLRDPLAYARRIVVNAARDDQQREKRGRRAYAEIGWAAAQAESEDIARSVVQRDALMTALGALPHRQRAVLALRYFSDLTEAQTAAVLEISTGTVKSQAFDALAHLRVLLGAERGEAANAKEKS